MTEEEWLTARSVWRIETHPVCQHSRRRRLLACSKVRHILPHVEEELTPIALQLAEQYADGNIVAGDLQAMRDRVLQTRDEMRGNSRRYNTPSWYSIAASECITRRKSGHVLEALIWSSMFCYAVRGVNFTILSDLNPVTLAHD